MGEKEEMKEMFQELTGFEKKNISLRINGVPASPMQIAQAHTICKYPADQNESFDENVEI